MGYGLANERLGLWHLASMLGCTVGQVNESFCRSRVALHVLSLRPG
jgi:hypothetical protein